ncbi:MAG TPA: thiamine phosphate synthase [Acidobacteriota bacterium]|jgi:thiamine-phosphate pyrophosphorylase
MNHHRSIQYHLITDHHQYRQPIHEIAQQAELNGIRYFQLREKQIAKRELLDIANHIRPELDQTKLIVNSHLDVALACQADGVHLQAGNISVKEVRKNFPGLIIGYSAHSAEEILAAESEGADYVFVSPIFPPISKRENLPALGIEKLKEWSSLVHIPVFALGGITPANLSEVANAGCHCVAGISLFLRNGQFTAEGLVL